MIIRGGGGEASKFLQSGDSSGKYKNTPRAPSLLHETTEMEYLANIINRVRVVQPVVVQKISQVEVHRIEIKSHVS